MYIWTQKLVQRRIEGLLFKFHRVLSLWVPFGNHVHKMIGEYKGYSFPPNSKLALEVPQDVTKIDVEQLQRKRMRIKHQTFDNQSPVSHFKV